MSNKMQFSIGMHNPALVEISNRQGFVEYKVLHGRTDEQEVRRSVGNSGRGCYEKSFSGYWMDRKLAVDRMEDKIKMLKDEIDRLEFSVRVTKKRNWVKLEEDK